MCKRTYSITATSRHGHMMMFQVSPHLKNGTISLCAFIVDANNAFLFICCMCLWLHVAFLQKEEQLILP